MMTTIPKTKIKIARRRAKFSAPSRCSFVIFDNQIDAAVAAQSVLLPLDGTKFVTHRAPGPDNVNWLSLFKTNNEKFVRRLLMLPLILFIIIFPSGFFLSAMTVLNQLFCTPNCNAWAAFSAERIPEVLGDEIKGRYARFFRQP